MGNWKRRSESPGRRCALVADVPWAYPNSGFTRSFDLTAAWLATYNLDQKSKELAAVKQKGYDYKLYKTSVNGKEITKVLIGPFEKENIANELAKIRKEVAKDAFSFTLQ